MLKKAFLFGIILTFLFLTVGFVFMKNGGEKITVEAKNETTVNDSFENIEPNDDLPEMKNPRIVVKEADRKLEIFDGEKLIKTYRVGLGFAPAGDKEKQGDGKTPEGEFYIFTKNSKSSYYLSLGVSYPSTDDAERGLRDKLISKKQRDEIVEAIRNKKTPPQKTKLGGEIYIHGNGSSNDWTWGCVALENAEMKEIFDVITVGTSVKIEP
ncbi:MAG: L,D-transpeptidase [Pyrinomonadaceae bacterium]